VFDKKISKTDKFISDHGSRNRRENLCLETWNERAAPQVADFILRNGNQSCFLNATDLASASGVSPSCVVRFAQKLGYDGFYSFRSKLQSKVREHLGYSERVSKTLKSVSKKSILRQSLRDDIDSTLSSSLSPLGKK
jgi:DNA-binding MurR/RpiR family transcriptional regulator